MKEIKSIIQIRRHLQASLIASNTSLGLMKIAETGSPFTLTNGVLGFDASAFDVDETGILAVLADNDYQDDTFNEGKYALKAGSSSQNFSANDLTVAGALTISGNFGIGGRWITIGSTTPTNSDAGLIVKGLGDVTLTTLFYDYSQSIWNLDKGMYFGGVINTALGGTSTQWKTAYDHSQIVTGQAHAMWSKTGTTVSYTGGITEMSNVYITGTIQSPVFASGFTGSGWAILSNASAYFQNLEVRGEMRVYTMKVEEMKVSGGSQLYTDGIEITRVEEYSYLGYPFYYVYYSNTNKPYNVFAAGDVVRCQQWNGSTEIRYYQARVESVHLNATATENSFYIWKYADPYWWTGTGTPAAFDSVARVSGTVMEVTSRDGGFIQIANGITDASGSFNPLMRIGNINGISLSGGIRAGVGYGLLTKYLVIDDAGAKISAFTFDGNKLYTDNLELQGSQLLLKGNYSALVFSTGGVTSSITNNDYPARMLIQSTNNVEIQTGTNYGFLLSSLVLHAYGGEPSTVPSKGLYKMAESGGTGRYIVYVKS